jgi:hypothetical protein
VASPARDHRHLHQHIVPRYGREFKLSRSSRGAPRRCLASSVPMRAEIAAAWPPLIHGNSQPHQLRMGVPRLWAPEGAVTDITTRAAAPRNLGSSRVKRGFAQMLGEASSWGCRRSAARISGMPEQSRGHGALGAFRGHPRAKGRLPTPRATHRPDRIDHRRVSQSRDGKETRIPAILSRRRSYRPSRWDYIDRSEVLSPADYVNHIDKWPFTAFPSSAGRRTWVRSTPSASMKVRP